jgi:NAD(P)-dependent dehydrogenase (short-subunit alcohol dehydrogenase family)
VRSVVVTGASSGIGSAVASALARAGFATYAGVRSDRDAHRLKCIHDLIRPLRLDVTDSASIEAAAGEVRNGGIPLTALVNNAGIALGGPLESVPIGELRRQFEVNTIGAVAVTQAFLPLLREAPGSRIVFMGSVSGRIAIPYVAPYSASKFALRAIADALRIELLPAGVDVCLIEPGSVATPIWGKARAMRDAMLARVTPGMPEYYRKAIESVVGGIEAEERTGLSPQRVGEIVLRTVTARKPKANRIVGPPARIGTLLTLLPAWLHARLLRSTMRLP